MRTWFPIAIRTAALGRVARLITGAAPALTLLAQPCAAAEAKEVALVRAAQKAAYVVAASTNGCPLTNEYASRGWREATVKYCEYQLVDQGLKTHRIAIAYLLEIEPATIANWIVSACDQLIDRRGNCFVTMLRIAQANSGMMFPVAGNIIEDMDRPKFYKNYIFQNGMTVAPTLKANGSSQVMSVKTQREFIRYSPDELAGIKSGKTRFWGTVPSQVRARFPGLNAPPRLNAGSGNARWLDLVRGEMVAALKLNRNRLVEAYLCANSTKLFATSCRQPQP